MNKAEHINAAVNAAKGINISIWLTIGVGVIMLVLGIFVGMSGLGAQLNHAIQGNTTATVHSALMGLLR